MEVQGKIILKLEPQGGLSRAGNQWKKQQYVLETINEPYPRKVHFDFFGERVDQYPLEVGDVITLSFDIESREFNGRWYTDIRGWKAEKIQAGAATPAPASQAAAPATPAQDAPAPAPAPDFTPDGDGNDDLPF